MSRGARPAAVPGIARRAALVCFALAAVSVGFALWIPAKAALAQVLLDAAFQRTRAGAAPARPWPWSDAWPVARIEAPAHGERLVVLSDASGRSLAFAPGHLSGTALPGDAGTSIVAGHRDTHFAFLRRLRPGDVLRVEDRQGRRHRYRVAETAVVHERDARVAAETDVDRLVLVTCWPFEALRPGTDLRFVVLAEREPARPPREDPTGPGSPLGAA